MTEDDVKMSCPRCDYFEVWSKEDEGVFFYCKNKKCRRCTCTICKKSFKYPKDCRNLTKKEKKRLEQGKGQQRHIKCIEYKRYVEEITEICEQQGKRYCPKCGFGGRKDERCTHIICNKCSHKFCYVCGLSLNKDDNSQHNSIRI